MSWKKHQLGDLLEYYSVRAKDIENFSDLKFCGVSNEEGITISKYAAEDKAEDYKVIEKGCFAYNPYRVNVGSIALMQKEKKGLISPAYVVFKTKPNSIVPELLLKFLKSPEGLRQIKQNARGTVRQALRFEDLCKIEISLPEYEEQIKLYNNLELTQNKCDIISSEYTHQLDLLKKLRQQILQDAVQGKLVPQDPNDEPASKLLERVKSRKRQLVTDKKLKLGKSTDKPLSLIGSRNIPAAWEWCKIDDIFFVTKLAGFEYTDHIVLKSVGEIPVVRAQNVRPIKIDKSNLLYIDKDTSYLLDRCSLTKKCLLVTFIGAGIGDVATFNEKERWHLAPNVAKVEPFEGCEDMIDVLYVNYFLLSRIGQEEIFKHVKATAQPSLSMSTIRDVDIPIPPLSEQLRITAKIERLMTICDELEQTIQQNQKYTQELLQLALKEALEQN